MREIRVYAPAKINLYLDILDKRKDGFHNIETIFEKIDLKDEIIIKEKGRGLKVRADAADCSQGKENIVYKAVAALLKEAKVKLNLDIEIKKHIPVSAGLGGGSSDAASSIRAVNDFFKLGISKKTLFKIALDTGKDVPFFMEGMPFAVGKGTGEALEKLNLDYSLFHILIKPRISLSTKLMYVRIDKCNFSDKRSFFKDTISALKSQDLNSLEDSYYNIFERALGRDSAHIDRIKGILLELRNKKSLLSGSGPTVFCTFKSKKDAEKVFKKIPKRKGMSVFMVKTYKGGIYGNNRG